MIELSGRLRLNFFELAQAVKILYDADPSFLHPIQAETGISRRMAYCLLDVGKLIDAGDLSKSDAEEIGWTKLQIVARHIMDHESVTQEEFEKFLDIARVTKARDLRQAFMGQQNTETRAEVFHLTQDEQSILREALVAFGAKKVPSGFTSKEVALMQIIDAAMGAQS